MDVQDVTPILNVSSLGDSFTWFERLGWRKHWEHGDPPTFGAVISGTPEILLCEGCQVWAPGWKTNPQHDPRVEGTRPPQFAADLKRAIAGLEGIAAAGPSTLDPGTDPLAACRWLTGYVGRTNIPASICCSSVCRSGAIEPDA